MNTSSQGNRINASGRRRRTARLATLLAAGLLAAALPVAPATASWPASVGSFPGGIAIDDAGYIYVTNLSPNDTVTQVSPGGTVVNTWSLPIASPFDLTIDKSGNVLTSNNNTGNVTRIAPGTPAGTVSPLTPSSATSPIGIAVDAAGNAYTANQNSPGTVTKVAPDGTTSIINSGGDVPYGVTVDYDGNIFVTNYGGSPTGTVSKITAGGQVTSDFGHTGLSPWGVTTDWQGNVYTANLGDSTVGKITAAGQSTPAFGTITPTTYPVGITIDSAGNLYTVNQDSPGTVSKFSPTGTLEATWTTGSQSWFITIDSSGNLYTSDFGAGTVTKLSQAGVAPAPPARSAIPTATAGDASATVTIAANPTSARYGAPTSYIITAVEDPTKSCTVTAPATSCEVTGLTNGTSYTFTSRAALNAWRTPPSGPSNAVTPAGSTPPTPPTPSNAFVIRSTRTVGSSVATRVRVPGAGIVNQRGAFRTGNRTRTACISSRTATKAGTYTLACRLNAAAKAQRKKGNLRVRIRTTFTPTGGTARSTFRTVVFRSLKPNFTG